MGTALPARPPGPDVEGARLDVDEDTGLDAGAIVASSSSTSSVTTDEEFLRNPAVDRGELARSGFAALDGEEAGRSSLLLNERGRGCAGAGPGGGVETTRGVGCGELRPLVALVLKDAVTGLCAWESGTCVVEGVRSRGALMESRCISTFSMNGVAG